MIIKGSKGGKGSSGGAQRVAKEAPNSLRSKALLRTVEIISQGEIEGLVDGAKSIFLDDTPLQNSDGTYNFDGIKFETRNGTPDQAHISGFPKVEDEVSVGVKITNASPVVRTVTDSDTDAVMVTIRLPSLTEQNTTNGDLGGSSVQLKIEYKPSGGSYITSITDTITGKTTSPYERQYRVNLTGSAPWDIRVTRLSTDNTAANIQNDIYFSSYTRILDHKLIYPDWALIGLSADSAFFGSEIPQRSYDIKGIKINVPTNYDPETREYSGVWDGTFKVAWSDNPAWILYDLLTNNRYGLGTYIDVEEIDKYGLYTIGQYCDEMVSDGAGGEEARFTFNGVLETQQDALEVLQVVASSFRGMLYWGAEGNSGVITAVQDAPKDPIKIFSPANVIDGMFTYAGASSEAQHAAAYVTWNDPNDSYKPAIEVVECEMTAEMQSYRKVDVVAFGCTSQAQAHRFGKWVLETEMNETETVLFKVGLGDADIRPADIIKIFDPSIADVRFGGRVISATSSSITIDSSVTLESGQTYSLDVVLPDGTLESRDITNSAGDFTVLNITPNFSQIPEALTMWAISGSNLAPRLFRVVSVRENSSIEFDVVALLHDPNKYDRVEQGINTSTVSFTKLKSGIIEPPTSLTYYEYLVASGTLLRGAVNLSWQASQDSRVVRYEVEAKKAGGTGNYEFVASTTGLSAVIEGTVDGTWSFRVKAIDGLGKESQYLTLSDQTLLINSSTPDDVANFRISSLRDTSILSWQAVTSRNLSHYEIRFSNSTSGADWNVASLMVDKISKDATSVLVPSKTGTYMIKAVSVATVQYPRGVYSSNASLIITDIDFLTTYNFIEELIEDPNYTGTKVDTVHDGTDLRLDEISTGVYYDYGEYYHHNYIDLGDVYTSRVSPYIVATGSLSTNDVDLWEDVDNITDVDGDTEGLWSVAVQVSTTKDDPASGSAVWSEYYTIDVADVNARGLKFRTLLYSYNENVTPLIDSLKVSVDMPDVIQSGEDINSSSSADTVVNFAKVFKSSRPAVVITPQGMATGDYVDLDPANIDESGFTFNIRNSAGNRVARSFDYHAKGYGLIS